MDHGENISAQKNGLAMLGVYINMHATDLTNPRIVVTPRRRGRNRSGGALPVSEMSRFLKT